jgi:signal transduction histidine kinase/CheY-like chemotaxis protein
MRKKSKIFFLLASFGVILLALIPIYILSNKRYSGKLKQTVGQMQHPRHEIEKIDHAIQLLYIAENNFRWYSLTGDSSRKQRYNEELSDLSDLLDKIIQQYNADSGLSSMLTAKQQAMRSLLQARLYADSLWDQARFLDVRPPHSFASASGTYPAGQPTSADSMLMESYSVHHREQKGLLGRIRDAILNKPSSVDSVKKIKIQVSQGGNTATNSLLTDDEINDSTHLWVNLLSRLTDARTTIHYRGVALMMSNELLFDGLRKSLNTLRDNEFALSKIRNDTIVSNAGTLIEEYRLKKILTVSFIIILTLIILFFIWQFYRNEEILWHAKRNAEQFARLKSNFAATVSHEIRGLSHAINASVEAFSEKQTPSRRKELLNTMKSSWGTLTTMLNNILDYTRMEQPDQIILKAPFMPAQAIAEVADTLRARAERKAIGMKMALSLPDNLVVSGNESQFKQILINLFGNAIKFTAEGSVTVEAYLAKNASPEEVRLTVSVKDTGRGIAQKDLPLIFEEFQQIDPEKDPMIVRGSGLGLAIVRRIIEQHGGKIEVKSEPGVGSEFCFHLTYPAVQPAGIKTPLPTTDKRPLTGLRVMVVENELLHRKYLTMLLSKAGMTFIEASDGQEALTLLAKQEVDLILTDINMPGMTGTELAREIRSISEKNKSRIPILALTATVSEEDIHQFKAVGMNDFLIKPFTPEDLITKLSDVVSQTSINNP